MSKEQKIQEVLEVLGPDLIEQKTALGELTITTYVGSLLRVLSILRDHPAGQFKMLVDICGVDYPQEEKRFRVVYHLLSLCHNQRIRVKVVTDGHMPIPSVIGLYKTANWFEREVWDLFGIPFADHPDLRRILTDYNFDGHPLRKDFPLTGYVEVRYDDSLKRVVYEPVRLNQDFRSFDFLSPWEGMLQQKLPTPNEEEKVAS